MSKLVDANNRFILNVDDEANFIQGPQIAVIITCKILYSYILKKVQCVTLRIGNMLNSKQIVSSSSPEKLPTATNSSCL